MKIAIVGAGASWMMCWASMLEKWFVWEIHIFDKNDTMWKKVSITWWGRCNLTTWLRDRKKILSNYIRWSDFLDYSIRKFSPSSCYKWFENHGVPLKIEKDLRIFPQSNKSSDIIWVFENIFETSDSVFFHSWESVKNIVISDWVFSLNTDNWDYVFDKVLIATGGSTYQKTWSTGDAYSWAEKMWHTIVPLTTSLSSFVVKEKWLTKMSWISFPQAKIIFGDKHIEGPMLFTHRWISGPLIFKLSAFLAYQDVDEQKPFSLRLQFDWQKGFDYWNQFLLDNQQKYGQKSLKNILYSEFPKRFVDLLLSQLFQKLLDSKIHDLIKVDRKKLCHTLSWEFVITLIWKKSGDEFVTAGWISCEEVNSKTMESKKIKNLFFAGECLDVDGVTWWFNLQAAWAMGRVAADAML